MGKTKNPDFDAIIQKAVNAGRMQGMSVAKDAYKATERRLYAIPVLKLKVKEVSSRAPVWGASVNLHKKHVANLCKICIFLPNCRF